MGKIKGIISQNTLLFRSWFYLIRKHRGSKVQLPARSDSFYLDGYPRSGNTYTKGYVKRALPNCSFASHLHTVAGMKIALSMGLTTFILIRKPEKALLSNLFRVVKTKKKVVSPTLIDGLAWQYLIFYKFVHRKNSSITVFEFDTVIHNEKMVVDTITDKVGLPILKDEIFDEILHSYKKRMKKIEDGKADAASSLPNKRRNEFKNTYHSQIVKSQYYEECDALYRKILIT